MASLYDSRNTNRFMTSEDTTMKAIIYCETAEHGVHSFYLLNEGQKHFLFSQDYRKGVQEYFGKGVTLKQSMNYSKTHNDSALVRTMTKIPVYLRYVEKEYQIEVLEQTKRRNSKNYHFHEKRCA